MRSRRAVLRWLGLAGWAGGIGRSNAQQALPLPRIGVLWFASVNDTTPRGALFRQRLRELGHIDGRTLVIDERYAEGSASRLDELAREFVRARVAVIVTPAVAATMAARRATDTIPIVMIHAGNPIGAGLIASLARPGGNVTGTANVPLGGKHVELMHEIVPRMSRLAVLVNPSNAGARLFVASLSEAARRLGIEVVVIEATRAQDLADALVSIRKARADWLHVVDEPMLSAHRAEWVAFAAAARLPLSGDVGETARVGGLLSYAPVLADHYVLAAVYVDKILKGAKPADLPVEEPTRYELTLNLQTARALGLTMPASVLLRATQVIE